MRKLADVCQEKGIRDKVILIAGGTQVTREMAAETGLDATFGRGTKGIHVVDAIVKIEGTWSVISGQARLRRMTAAYDPGSRSKS